jgi:hypothetical protein
METYFPYIKIPMEFARLIGRPDPGTRIFRREGTVEEMREWFDKLCEHIGPTVSPGGAAVYAGVTRAGVNKRLKAGKLTIFCFYTIEKTKTLFGKEKTIKDFPSGYIPVSECKAWRKELEERIQRIEARKGPNPMTPDDEAALAETDGDEEDMKSDFLNYDPHDKRRKGVRYRYPWESSPVERPYDKEEERGREK